MALEIAGQHPNAERQRYDHVDQDQAPIGIDQSQHANVMKSGTMIAAVGSNWPIRMKACQSGLPGN